MMRDMNAAPKPLNWSDIINELDELKLEELKHFKSKDYAVAKLISKIRELLKKNDFHLSYFNNRYYIYQDSYWNEILSDKVELFLRDCTKKFYCKEIKYHTNTFYKPLEDSFRKEMKVFVEDNNKAILLNCRNCTLEFNQKEVLPREAKKEDYITYRLSYDYDPEATSPMWDSFLDEMLPSKDQQFLLHQYIGYSFTNNIKLEKALFLYGEGGNGKSVVQEVITELLGKENTSCVSIGKLTKDQNAIMLIEGKLLNYCSENERRFNLAQFRTLASGEPLIGKKLYSDVRQVDRYAKLMFNMNSLPIVNEERESFLRRLLILEFNKKPKKKDPQLHYKIIEKELNGIFNRIVKALYCLIQNKDFVDIPEINQFISDYNNDTDIVHQFVDNYNGTTVISSPVKVSELHESYVIYCNKHKETPLNLISFSKDLNKKGFKPEKRKDGNYYNIKVEGGSTIH